jgi:hypothetical protein
MQNAKILLRHPDKRVRELPPKVLEFKNKDDDLDSYFPEKVGDNTIYTLPVKYARRLLANQPERYFLLEPAVLPVRRVGQLGTVEHIIVKADTSALSKFNEASKPPIPPLPGPSAQELAEAAAKAEAEALSNASLPEGPSSRPPEL